MGTLILVAALGGLGLLLLSGKSEQFAKAFTKENGRLVYKPAVRDIIINQLRYKLAGAHSEHPTDMFRITQFGEEVPYADSAYWALHTIHENMGRDIWTPQTYWLPTKPGVKTEVWFGETPPPTKLGFARLISAAEPWPPLPTEIPPIPSEAPPIPG